MEYRDDVLSQRRHSGSQEKRSIGRFGEFTKLGQILLFSKHQGTPQRAQIEAHEVEEGPLAFLEGSQLCRCRGKSKSRGEEDDKVHHVLLACPHSGTGRKASPSNA